MMWYQFNPPDTSSKFKGIKNWFSMEKEGYLGKWAWPLNDVVSTWSFRHFQQVKGYQELIPNGKGQLPR